MSNYFISARVTCNPQSGPAAKAKRFRMDDVQHAVAMAIKNIAWPAINVDEMSVRAGDYPVVLKTDNELMEETKRILEASKEELERMHHAAFPAERASIRGVRHGRMSDMQTDLIVALFGH